MTDVEEIAKVICFTGIKLLRVNDEEEKDDVIQKRMDANWHHWRNYYLPIAAMVKHKMMQEKLLHQGA